jgi:integrase
LTQVRYRGYVIKPHGRGWRWEARFDGRRVRRTFDTEDEARAALDVFLEAREASRPLRTADLAIEDLGKGHMTVRDLCEAWFAWKTGPETDEPIRPRTRRDYRRVLDRFILPLIGPRDAASITTADLKREFFRECSSRTGARYSRTVLQQAFRWGIEERIIARRDNPCLDVRMARRDATDGRNRKQSSVRAVTDDQIPTPGEVQKMLIWAIETDRRVWWLWVYIAATLGLRPSEVCALQAEDFHAGRRLVTVSRSVPDRADPGDWHMKTATSARALKVGREFFDTVDAHLPDGSWLFDARARGGGRPQRTHTATPCWPADAPNREFRRMRRSLGLSERYTPYSLRHFVATRLILQGKAEIQVAKFLGTSVDMLRQVYANHLDDGAQREIGEAVTNLF